MDHFLFNQNCYLSQSDNAIEAIIRKTGSKSWLRSCGPTSSAMLVMAIGKPIECKSPAGEQIQPEDALFCYFNDPKNREILQAQRPEVNPDNFFGNQIPQFYPEAINRFFGARCSFSWGATFGQIILAINAGRGVMVQLTDPGHYIAIIGYSDDGEIIYNDPWPDNYWPRRYSGKSPEKRRVNYETELKPNLQPFRVEIG